MHDRNAAIANLQENTGAHFISPYNNKDIIDGQATVACEILEDIPDIDIIIAPVGGGGLISGTILTRDKTNPEVMIYGAEPSGADDAFMSIQHNKIMPSLTTKTI